MNRWVYRNRSAIVSSSVPSRGFTIVELLIVVVVVAVLASIAFVSYGSITRRANNTSRIVNANAAVKLVTAYVSAYGEYPYNVGTSCIGNGFAENNTRCWGIDSATPAMRAASINDNLLKVGSLPNNTTPPVKTSAWQALGPVYVYQSDGAINGESPAVMILFFLEGASQDCGGGDVLLLGSNKAYSTAPSGYPRFSGNLGNATLCYLAVPKL